ncbi:MAG: GNAT family N-acetyltransferase [Anaerolineales bacterium]|nr:GNAT family N-acetyltransferase [Anaerolineales bacterium]
MRQALERGEFFVAESGREFVGVFRLLDSDPAVWPDRADAAFYIHTLTVGRRRHGRGIGGSMLGWIEARAAECGRRFLRLDCFVENPVLCAYYARAGFESCGIREIQVRGTRIAVRRFEKAVRPS